MLIINEKYWMLNEVLPYIIMILCYYVRYFYITFNIVRLIYDIR